jgi:deazaflavin-dependent oxidoreductase (nitroreductase family)
MTLRLAGHAAFADLEHVGRKSGVLRHTPVRAFRTGDTVVVGLNFGRQSDWFKNIKAAGTRRMRLGNQQLILGGPTLVPVEQGTTHIPWLSDSVPDTWSTPTNACSCPSWTNTQCGERGHPARGRRFCEIEACLLRYLDRSTVDTGALQQPVEGFQARVGGRPAMPSGYRVLTAEQIEHFLERGFVFVPDCFAPEAAAEYTNTVWTRLGYDPYAPSTWAKPYVHMPAHREIDVRTFAPKAWGAVCDLVGGADRISTAKPYTWNDAFIVNLADGADLPWSPASPASPGWHKDGDFFRHFLDSPEQGLLTLVLWSDVPHQGGATFVAADSVSPVARYLAEHPEGVRAPESVPDPADGAYSGPDAGTFPYPQLIHQCHDFVEATGRAGDVYLLHPYILHAKAQNVRRVTRIITNPPVTLAEPMRFDRDDPSPVEVAVLRGLGVDRYEFRPGAARQALVPPRVALQQRMTDEERKRLAEAP